VGRGKQQLSVLSVFGTDFYSCYQWGEGSRSLMYYLCLKLAFTVVNCEERGAGAYSIICVWNWLLQLLSVGRGAGALCIIRVCGWTCVWLYVGGNALSFVWVAM
jgi:hypothetical protein